MCLYPRLIQNPRYKPNKKNGGVIPPVSDERVKYVPIGCQECIECRKKKAREWQLRLLEDIKEHTNGKFVTLTFSNESIQELVNQKPTKNWPGMADLTGYDLDNEIATRGTRLFLERWRKEYGKSLRHWFITELGHQGTENIHIHGIIWTNEKIETVADIWQYGYVWPKDSKEKNYVNSRTVNYIIKYVTKIDEDHKYYKSVILNSDGIGGNYTKRSDWKKNKFNGEETNETYRTPSGHKIAMPIYWRNKIYSDEEREKLWLYKLDKQKRYVCGEEVDVSKNEDSYWKLVEFYREKNHRLGYGNGEIKWERKKYEEELRALKYAKRLEQKKNTFSLKDGESYIEVGKWKDEMRE